MRLMRSMGKQLKIIFCALWLAAHPAWGVEPVQLPGAGVEELLALAQQHNPELAAMRLEAEAAAERSYPAGALPDPMFRAELMDIQRGHERLSQPVAKPGGQYALFGHAGGAFLGQARPEA